MVFKEQSEPQAKVIPFPLEKASPLAGINAEPAVIVDLSEFKHRQRETTYRQRALELGLLMLRSC